MIQEIPITQTEERSARLSLVCLGEALVDLICERPVSGLAEVDAFVPRIGGALANVATAAAQAGANTVLAGGVGDDEWGRWVERQLISSGIDLRWWRLHRNIRTPVAFVTINEQREPSFLIYGREDGALLQHLESQLEELVSTASCLVVGSNTLISASERSLTEKACQLASDSHVPVVFDPNLRPDRWEHTDDALPSCREILARSALLKVGVEECLWLSGKRDAVDGAADLSDRGPDVVLTRGENGAVLFVNGSQVVDVDSPQVETVDTTGAGDVLLGYLLSQYTGSSESIRLALPRAVDLAAHSTTYYGATTGLADLL